MQCPFGTWPCATIWDSQLQTRSYHHIKQNISKVFTLSIYLSVDNDIYYSLQQRNLKVMSFEVPGYHIYSVNVSSFLLTYLSLPFSLCLLLNHQSQIHTFFLILCFFSRDNMVSCYAKAHWLQTQSKRKIYSLLFIFRTSVLL